MRRLLVLRPEPGASATVERARALGLDAFAIPLFKIEPITWVLPDIVNFDGLLLTSANAVRFAGNGLEQLRGLSVYAVGHATEGAARDAGFDIAATGDKGIDRLLDSIDSGLKLLHLCAGDRREPSDHRQRITPLPVYVAKPIERPDLSAVNGAVAMIHSPRAGRRFGELVHDRRSMAISAISSAAADAVGGGWEAVEAVSEPDDEALLALAARLCKKPAPK